MKKDQSRKTLMIHETVFRHSLDPGDKRLLNERKRSRPKTNIQSQVVKSIIGFGSVVKRVS